MAFSQIVLNSYLSNYSIYILEYLYKIILKDRKKKRIEKVYSYIASIIAIISMPERDNPAMIKAMFLLL